MQILDYPQPATSTGIADAVLAGLKPSASAKSAIAKAQAEVDRLLGLVTACEPDRGGRTSQLHHEADMAEQVFLADPSRENAEALHVALVRCRDAEVSFKRIDSVIHHHLPRASKLAEPAALEIIDAALAELDRQHEAAKANISKASTLFQDVARLDRQHEAAKGELVGERNAVLTGDALHWLRLKGFAS
jgi:hypothetical protein